MGRKRSLRLAAALLAAGGLLVGATAASAAPSTTTVDFESGPAGSLNNAGDYIFDAGGPSGNAVAERVDSSDANAGADDIYADTHSARLYTPNDQETSDEFAKVHFAHTGVLNLTSGKFRGKLTPGMDDSPPYMYFGVDSNQNGQFDFGFTNSDDSFVITFNNGPSFDTTNTDADGWFVNGIDADSDVHVVGNRQGLSSGEYEAGPSSAAPLSQLRDEIYSGSTTWGDLDVVQGRVGESDRDTLEYEAFLDNIEVKTAPEPASLTLLAPAGLLLLRRRRAA